MNTKSDWQAVSERLMADDRRRAGEPPTAEEVLAYTRGELSPEEEALVRERLLPYPELVRTLTAVFPQEGAEPGDPDYLSDEQYAKHWAALQKRMPREGPAPEGRLLRFWRFSAAMAAAVALMLGVLLWQTAMSVSEPRVVGGEVIFDGGGRRGSTPETQTLTPKAGDALLYIPLSGQQGFASYRIEIIDRSTKRAIWSSPALVSREDDPSFAILIPSRFLEPGLYDIALYGTIGATEERLTQWPLRVSGR